MRCYKQELFCAMPAHGQFVLGVDQSVWATFGPRQLKDLLSRVGELKVKVQPGKSGVQKSSKGVGAGAFLKFLLAAAMVGILVPAFVVPHTNILTKISDALCGSHACRS